MYGRFSSLLVACMLSFTACGASVPQTSSVTLAPFVPNGRIDSRQLLQLQASGRLYTPLTHARIVQMLHAVNQPRSRFAAQTVPATKSVALWATLTADNDILGQAKKVSKTVAAIDTASNGCVYPVTVKVDASQNVWAGCEYNTDDDDGVYQEYTSTGTLAATYQDGCPAPTSECDQFYSTSMDGASNASDVFDALSYYYAEINCNPSCTDSYGGGFEYWPAGSSSSPPTLIALPYGQPVYGVAFMDLDSTGDIWFDYYGCSTASECGNGIAEITSPTTAPTFVAIESPGFLQCAGGVYASGASTVINVIDSCSRIVYQFAPSGGETGTLGPIGRLGDPISGSFNAADTKIAVGDEKGWLDVGKTKTNIWRQIANSYFHDGLMGAAYTPSDK
jgi:hypothetical protein